MFDLHISLAPYIHSLFALQFLVTRMLVDGYVVSILHDDDNDSEKERSRRVSQIPRLSHGGAGP